MAGPHHLAAVWVCLPTTWIQVDAARSLSQLQADLGGNKTNRRGGSQPFHQTTTSVKFLPSSSTMNLRRLHYTFFVDTESPDQTDCEWSHKAGVTGPGDTAAAATPTAATQPPTRCRRRSSQQQHRTETATHMFFPATGTAKLLSKKPSRITSAWEMGGVRPGEGRGLLC